MKKLIIIIILIIIITSALIYNSSYNKKQEKLQISILKQELLAREIKSFNFNDNDKNINLDVQFFPQAPYWKWHEPYDEACEEASVILAKNYIKWITQSKEEFNKELLELAEWEMSVFGDYKHTDVNQTARIIDKFFNISDYKIIDKPSISDIKYELKEWNIIIAPLYGKGLWNPYYSWDWPDYHFIVIKWYTDKYFITHDVWTSRWEDYVYEIDTIIKNIHDWDDFLIPAWKPRIIVLNNK